MLRSAAATNQVRFHVKHFFPPLSSVEYQKLLYDEKSTDDDDDSHRLYNISQNRNNNNNNATTTTNEVRMRKSSRRHHQQQNQEQLNQHSVYNVSHENRKHEQQHERNNPFEISHDALQALLNSKFKLMDLVDLLKKMYPQLLSNDPKRELQFIERLSERNTGERLFII